MILSSDTPLSSSDDLVNTLPNSLPDIKPGVKLIKSDDQWKAANLFFMVSLPICGLNSSNINDSIARMNSTFYNYFKDNFGYSMELISDQLMNKYKNIPKRSLKVALTFLKQSHTSLQEIRYAARLLRKILRTSANIPTSGFSHDTRIQNTVWNYVKQI